MSLRFVVDGYNIINHPSFNQAIKKHKDSRVALLELIREKKLCGSLKNKVTVVFDGYPDSSINADKLDIGVVFSLRISADEWIKRAIEKAPNCKEIMVVSDDREIKFFVRSCGAKSVSAQEFLSVGSKAHSPELTAQSEELSASQVRKINDELRQRWLK